MADALFVRSGGHFVPTELARGPWDPRHLHGGPPAALLAGLVEESAGPGFTISRLSVDLVRPVAMEPLAVRAEVVRPGRKVQLIEASLAAAGSGTELVKVRALAIRLGDVPTPVAEEPPVNGPESGRALPHRFGTDATAFHSHGIEHRFVEGSWLAFGPGTVWIRVLHPVVDGTELTPLQRVAACADFGNGVSNALDPADFTYINPDLTIHLVRAPRHEWIGLAARTHVSATGRGMAECALYDRDGRIGRSAQSLIIEPLG